MMTSHLKALTHCQNQNLRRGSAIIPLTFWLILVLSAELWKIYHPINLELTRLMIQQNRAQQRLCSDFFATN